VLDSLPARPLEEAEVIALTDQSDRIAPMTIARGESEDTLWIFTLVIVRREADTVHLVGFSETAEAWTEITTWTTDAADYDEMKAAAMAWLDEEFPDRDHDTYDGADHAV
jgi:hypothetical protein